MNINNKLVKHILAFILLPVSFYNVNAQAQKIVTADIDHFWAAYDRIVRTSDTAEQYRYLQQLYLDPATQGLKDLMEVRRYDAKGYIDAIRAYPAFWSSIRANTFKSKTLSHEIETGIEKLKQLYPALRASTIYFSIGLFRTNGTIRENNILIGSEMALSDKTVDVSGMPDHVREFNALYTPINDIGLLCTHEYVHTQQKELVHNLLSYCIYEGVAEFISTLATGKASYVNAIAYGKQNYLQVREQFERDLFNPSRTYNWLWSSNKLFGQRDLGYSVGFEMAQRYYNQAKNKPKAVAEMITLDFTNETAVEKFVDRSGYLSKPLNTLFREFETARPQVVGIRQFKNGAQVDANTTLVTLIFSEPMDPGLRGFDFGPLGEEYVLRVQNVIGFSEDRKEFTYEVSLQPGKRYQGLVSNRFASAAGVPLKPYLIDITTK